MFTVSLSIVALISAILTIYAKIAKKTSLEYFFKPFTMIAIIAMAIINSSSPATFYQNAILIGLVFSAIGDVLLIDEKRFFVYGLLSFLIAHICFIAAFWSDPNFLVVGLYLLYVLFFLRILWKHLGDLKIPVIVYSLILALMSWMALSLTISNHNHNTFHAFIGSILFVASDSLLAFNKFKTEFRYSEIAILATYFAAQWFIAISV
jgi:uncharacterized membrane protein YhhN